MIDRRHLTLGMGATVMISTASRASATPMPGGFAHRLSQAEAAGKIKGLHALLVSGEGRLIFEHYGQGEDESWGTPLGHVTFGPTVLHDLRSVSKSVVGLLYGIALADGKVPPPAAKLYAQFPEYADLAAQPGRERLTIAHVLSMTLGTDWDELAIPYGDLRNSENAMEAAPDRYRFILERPIVGEPGVKWTYCGGATALLGHLIAKGNGQPLLEYARRVLFEPLGFGPSEWTTGHDGEPHTASGPRLLPRDMLKMGELVLAGGAWQGRQIVPSDWVTRITASVVTIDAVRSYGYQWYIADLPVPALPQPEHLIAGIGWGGQRLYVAPRLKLVVAMNCGNYDRSGLEQSRVANTVLTEVVLAALASPS
jgi:CubicO group peptidase (beta-lactamase class C family)